MRFIRNYINQEVSYFRKLQADAQRLLLSIFLRDLVSPIFGLFINAFLWRQSQDLILVAIFNFAFFLVIPAGFYLNGLLLKKFSPGFLYFLSLLFSGIVVAGLIFLPSITYITVIAFGVLEGVCSGIYWAARNLLTLKTTHSDNRIYFSSLESASGTITGVFIPLVIGWFIAFGSIVHLYSKLQGYQMLAIVMLGTLGTVAFVTRKVSIKQYDIGHLFLKSPSKNWQKFQIIQFIWGLNSGITTFIPALLILILVGQEEALGTVQSASAIITAILMFALAKYLHVSHRLLLIFLSAILLIIGASIFGIVYSALGVFILIACQALAGSFEWVGFSSLNYDLIDNDGEAKANHYAYVCDQELYLNAGRVLAILLFIAIIQFGSKELALRFSPLIVATLQIFAYTFAKSITLQSPNTTAALDLKPLNKEG